MKTDIRATGAATPSVVGADPRRWLALAVIAIAQLIVVLDASIVTVALPSLQHDLGISDANRQWVITAYTLTFGGLLLLGGRIADYQGRKRMFIIGLIGFASASALGGLAPNSALLFSARAAQGAFGALLAPAALSLLTVTFTDAKERAKAFGVYGGISGGGAAIGLIAGGLLTEFASWRWCLLVIAPIAIGAAFAASAVVSESKAHGDTRYDFPGAVLVTGGLVSLVYGITTAATHGWSDPLTVGMFAVAAILLAAFVVVEARSSHPLLPLRIVLDSTRGGTYLVSLLLGGSMFAMFLFLTFFMQGILGYSPLRCGIAFLPFTVGIVIGAGTASQLLPRRGSRPLMTAGLLLAIAGTAWLTRLEVSSSYATALLPAMIVMSVGMGLVFVPLASAALMGVPDHDAGVASAMVNTSQQVGGSLGTALLNTVAASATAAFVVAHGAAAQAEALVHGYTVAFSCGVVMLTAAALVTLLMIRARPANVASLPPAAVPAQREPV